jgi:methionyl-tRNA formyltransferase
MDGFCLMQTLRILFFGDGAWATNSLQQLHAAGHTFVGLVARTRPSDGHLLETAERLGIPVFQPARVNAPEVVAQLADLQADVNLSISYNQILRAALLESAPLGSVNFHAGKLPFYRGRNVINWAIINGETEIGLTAHYMDEGIDTGDILLQHTLPIHWTDTYGDVLSRVVEAFPALVMETIERLVSGTLTPTPQAHLPGTYFGGREQGDEWLDWTETSRNLYNKTRAITHPGPGAVTLLGDQRVIVWRAAYDPAWPQYIATPGQVVGLRPTGVLVKTGDSLLLLEEVQVGAEPPAVPRWRIGTRLGINLMEYLQTLTANLAMMRAETAHRTQTNSYPNEGTEL